MTELTIFEQDMRNLKAKLKRLEARRDKGLYATESLTVPVELLEDLINEIEDLKRAAS